MSEGRHKVGVCATDLVDNGSEPGDAWLQWQQVQVE